MSDRLTDRQSMLVAGIVQGAAMIVLHDGFVKHGLRAADLAWIAPCYALAVLGPLTFNMLRAEFTAGRSLLGAAVVALAVAATAAWFGWAAVPAQDDATLLVGRASGLFVFGLSSAVAWFVALPFVQGALRAGRLRYAYAQLFDDAWRNALLLNNCVVFATVFWLLLALWAGLFAVLEMRFFVDLFSSRYFIYLATTLAIGFAVSMEERGAAATAALRRYLLAFQTRLLPLAALIVLLFVAALPFAGLQPLWNTRHATPLLLCLQFALIALANAAWQDGAQPAPFSAPVQWLVRAALALLPVLAALCVWSLSLRVRQYGWTVDRVWATVLVGFAALYGLGYASSAAGRGWLPSLGRVNTGIALALVATLLAIHSPLLDPQRIAAASQLARLLDGRIDAERFDYDHLRFELGRAGHAALAKLAAGAAHPESALVGRRADEALARTRRGQRAPEVAPDGATIARKLKIHPTDARLDPTFVDHLASRLEKKRIDFDVSSLEGDKPVPLLLIELGGEVGAEAVLLAPPYPVFSADARGWRQIGQLHFGASAPKPEQLAKLLEEGRYAAAPRGWRDLKLGEDEAFLSLQRGRRPD